jgi:hypothetical protein
MNKLILNKVIGFCLLLTAIALFILKFISLPELLNSSEGFLSTNSNYEQTIFVVFILFFELIFLISRFVLGYYLVLNKELRNWQFYLLIILVGLSGFYLTGVILSLLALFVRSFKDQLRT